MTGPNTDGNRAAHLDDAATESSPLLGDGKAQEDNDSIERGQTVHGTTDQEQDVPLAHELSTGKLLLVLSPVWLGCFLAALDSTIIATLSAPISTSFNSLSLLSWLASAYLIANAALQPLSGRLTDILSRRTGLVFSNVFFCAGNLICGLAKSEWVMIFGRVIAGMGGGGLTAISTFIASDLIPLRKRGVWQGFGNICYGVGAGLGGIFGGWINDHGGGWRNAFLIQVPLTVVSGLLAWFLVDIPVKRTEKAAWKRIDIWGAITLIVTLVLLLLGLNSGGNVVPWSHPLVLTSLPLSAIFLGLFIYIESMYAEEPVIPVRLLLDRTVLSACLTNWFATMSMFALLFYGPIYFQVKGLSATQAGVRLIPNSIGALGSVSSGLVMGWTGRYYYLSIVIMLIFVASLSILSTFNLTTPAWEPFVVFFFAGVGYSGMLTTTLVALISAVDHRHQAVITSASYAFRSTGSALGITIASAVFQNILKLELWGRFGDRKNAIEIIGKVRNSLDEIQNLPPSWKAGVKDVYMDALRGVFLTTLGLAVLGLLVSLAMREHKLHTNLARK